jgi:hypothetical protein
VLEQRHQAMGPGEAMTQIGFSLCLGVRDLHLPLISGDLTRLPGSAMMQAAAVVDTKCSLAARRGKAQLWMRLASIH